MDSHIDDMLFYIKTTPNINDATVARLKQEASHRGGTISELVETALRLLLQERKPKKKLPKLPTFNSKGPLVDIADREALYQATEGR